MTDPVLELLDNRRMELGPTDAKSASGSYKHWRITRDQDAIAWLLFDKKDSSTNTLSREVLEELGKITEALAGNPPKGLVIRSAKASGFCAGADIGDFRQVENAEAMREQLTAGKAILDRIEGFDFPVVAVVHGHCLGGGFELALACDYRIAIEGAKFAFPEVQLGLHPGLDGTVRLPRLIDPVEAMTLMLTGSSAHTSKAKRLGIVDVVTPERHVDGAVRAAIAGNIHASEHSLKDDALATAPARAVIARQMRSTAEERAPEEHYPAPYALIELWHEHGGNRKKMQEAETRSFADLMFTATAQNLIRVFFLREKLKTFGDGDATIVHVHVIGAGAMGGDIAAVCAIKGMIVTLSDLDNEAIAGAVKRAAKTAKDMHLNSAEIRDALDRLIPDPQNSGVSHADLIIEAGPEKAEIKEKIYGSIEKRMKKDAVLATNTSSIPLATLAKKLGDPARFVGIHFFNPVAKLDLVEVVSHEKVSDKTLDAARAFVGQMGKLPAPVKSAPGFLVNRSLMPYLLEAIIMVDEGSAPETIDKAAEDFGMPVGPLELADQVGLDICLSVAGVLRGKLDAPVPEVPNWLQENVANKNLGKKTGRGIYEWKDGKAQKDSSFDDPDEAMQDRLTLPMLNACAACLREGVVDDADTLDAAVIFATGFAPFRGGPMNYARDRGYDDVAKTLESLEREHGKRFEPDPFWQENTKG